MGSSSCSLAQVYSSAPGCGRHGQGTLLSQAVRRLGCCTTVRPAELGLRGPLSLCLGTGLARWHRAALCRLGTPHPPSSLHTEVHPYPGH